MCGIAGLLDPTHALRAEELEAQATSMTDAVVHRGPDDGGVWVDDRAGVALGNRRLAIVGLGPGGHQPMASASGRWVVTFNGEVYNFSSLRRRLEAQGVRLRGGSDTEVLIEAVERWGLEEALDASEGMFAMAAWDARDKELHLVRDRLGEKPLYFGWVGRCFAFASELKSLRCLPDFAPRLDRGAVALFLRHNCVPAPRSAYVGVAKVEPGQLMTIGPGSRPGDEPVSRRYWSARSVVEQARHHPLSGSPAALADRVEATLDEAVAARMVADVPVGAFLSGGVDSSLVVALMGRHSDRPVKTFTVGFADHAFDESADAAAVAAHLGTDHSTLTVTDKEALEVIAELPTIWDEPFADSSQIPTLLVSRLARSAVTVSLSGDGGDELFGGYNRHAWLERLWRRSAWLPAPGRRAVGRAVARVPPGVVDGAARLTGALPTRWRVRNPAIKLTKVGKVLAADTVEGAYLALVSHWPDPEALVIGAGAVATLAADPSSWADLGGVTEQMLWLDLVGYLPDDILVKLDRASMSASLEGRVPFLDRRVVELAWSLPMDVKVRDGVTKWILREVLYRHVPAALVERPKMGFGLPIGPWLRGPLRPWAEELLAERRLRDGGVIDPLPVRRAWHQHLSGRRDLGYELWDVLSLQAWLDRWKPST